MSAPFPMTDVVRAMMEGRADWSWVPITVGPIRLWVMPDAMKVDGVRVAVSAREAQRVADVLNASLTTPKIEDLIWENASRRIEPILGNTAKTTDKQQSAKIDAALANVAGPASGIVATVGKSWCLSNKLTPTKACNYGWHTKAKSGSGGPYKSVSIPGISVWQSPGFAHNADHYDYSQNLRLVNRVASVDEHPMDLFQILRDPELAAYVSHEGPLSVLRQPGVDVVSNVTPKPTLVSFASSSSKARARSSSWASLFARALPIAAGITGAITIGLVSTR